MATFPSIQPTYSGFRKTSKPKVRVSRLGDGYEFRSLYGLPFTQDPKVYDLVFNVSEEQSDEIEAFLRSRVFDQASFTFTPPAEGFSSKDGVFVQSNGKTGSQVASGRVISIFSLESGAPKAHNLALGDIVTINFPPVSPEQSEAGRNGPSDGDYAVTSIPSFFNFIVNSAANESNLITSAENLTFSLSGEGQFVCDSWTKTIPYNNRAIINCTFREVFEP